jgi:hypothetical protein
MDWDLSYRLFLVDFCVFGGDEEIFISDKYDPLGNIAFERIIPGHILRDPEWKSGNGWDLNNTIKIAYLTEEQLKEKYNLDNEELDAAIEMNKKNGPYFDSTDFDSADIPELDLNDSYGKKYRVIEDHSLKVEKRKAEFVFTKEGRITEVPKDYSDEEKREWVILNDIDIGAGVIEKEIKFKKYYKTTICPSLFIEKPIESKEPIIQIGRLPFFHASYCHVDGKDCGLVDDLKDIQQTINKRESLIDHMIANSASGATAIDPILVGGDVIELENLKANWNNPTYRFYSAPGEISSGRRHIEEMPRAQFPANIVNELQRMWEMSDRIPPITSAMDGRSEGSEDRSSVLYARKQQQAEINLTMALKTLEHYANEKGEAYMLVAQSLYSGVYREFRVPGEQNVIKINEQVETPEGTIIVNDLSAMPRHKVIVSQSPQGITYREVQRTINSELLQYIPPQNPISKAIAVANVMKALDTSAEERREYEIASELEKQLAFESIKSQILGFKAQQAALEAQLQTQSQQMLQPDQAQQNQLPEVQPQEGAQEIAPVLPQ